MAVGLAVTGDGERFLFVKPDERAAFENVVVQNRLEAEALVPTQ